MDDVSEITKLKERVELLENVIADLSYSDRYIFQKHLQIMDARNILLGTSTGTKIGTATTQKLGFFGKTPVIQPASAEQYALSLDATAGAGHVDAANVQGNFDSIQESYNEIRLALVNLGIIKGSA